MLLQIGEIGFQIVMMPLAEPAHALYALLEELGFRTHFQQQYGCVRRGFVLPPIQDTMVRSIRNQATIFSPTER